jgi:hypothetical protein
MKKMKKFQDGGTADENFTPEQLKFLGGADRTDPYILARMRKAAPDAPKVAKVDTKVDSGELRDETGEKSKVRRNTETGELYDTEIYTPKVTPKAEAVAPKATPKVEAAPAPKESKPETKDKKTTLKEFRESLKSPDILKPYKKSDIENPKSKANLSDLKFGNLTKSLREKAGITSYKSGGKVSSASKRADGIAIRGKTRA